MDAAGLSSRSVFKPSGFCGDVVLSGDEPGFGEPVGEALGLVTGLADGATVGLATGGLFGAVLVFGSQAPNTATLAAKTVDKINDLLIVFLLSNRNTRTTSAAQTPTAGLMRCVFLQTCGHFARRLPLYINAAITRTRGMADSCRIFDEVVSVRLCRQ